MNEAGARIIRMGESFEGMGASVARVSEVDAAPGEPDIIPSFQELPVLPYADWMSDTLKATHSELTKDGETLRSDQAELVGKLRQRLTEDPLSITVSRPGVRQKAEFGLLDREALYRGRVQNFYESFHTEGNDELQKLHNELVSVRDESERRIVRAMSDLGIERRVYESHLAMYVNFCTSVLEARGHTTRLGKRLDTARTFTHQHAIKKCRERQEVLRRELVSMC